ncbi:MAG TPA: multicopper oxidase domain-containing protein [Terracidiphilus sp.]|nr:multicopper oxidase domain-containing protein [Terracidiphilus sp.]
MKRNHAARLSRREFVRKTGVLAAACVLPGSVQATTPAVELDPGKLKRFVDPLPILPIARPAGMQPDPANPAEKLPVYRMTMSEVESSVHRDLKPAHMWGFNGVSPGPVIEAGSGRGVLVEWVNRLPQRHLFTIDHNLMGAERDKPDVRSVVHLHGAKAPPESDGYPESWIVAGKSQACHYPNRQDACLLWYHDHAMGINRLNIYAGLLGLYIIRDEAEEALGLPRGDFEIPLVLCDRKFTIDGQLAYDVSPDPAAPWMPEFYGNATLVNGKLFPYLDVQPTLYRFRVLNGSNSQFFSLSLSSGQPLAQIGSDQGLLPAPVTSKTVLLGPGERADLAVDFSSSSGQQVTLKIGPVEEIMQFRVGSAGAKKVQLPEKLRPVAAIPESAAVRTRLLTLNEYKSPKGESMTMLLGGAHWNMPVTETPQLDTVEIWSLINLTEDVHPIHLHLVRFQILDRRPFDQLHYFMKAELKFIGQPIPPDPGEAGWKDTVQAHPQMVTRIIARFEGYAGRYVWHCHILEHEDNEMMRPFEVVKGGSV